MPHLVLSQLVFLSLCCAFLKPLPATPNVQSGTSNGTLPVFELHSGFWINLHHTLYQEARQRTAPSSERENNNRRRSALKPMQDTKTTLGAAEQRVWDEAVSYYTENYADQDLLFSTELTLLKNQLGDFEACDELSGAKIKTCNAGLPAKLTGILEAAAPVYRAHFWPDHDRANRAWIVRAAPLVEEQSLGIAQRLADFFQASWPKEKIRVDLTAYAGGAGAYTTLQPLRVTISSTDARNQGGEALKVLFHEASHGIAEPVQRTIIRECRQREKAIPRDLWHALIFYTTVQAIKPLIISPGTGGQDADIPKAIREDLSRRGWTNYLPLLIRFWQPYLDGKATFDDAIARIVSAL
jgi:hypothetical protein